MQHSLEILLQCPSGCIQLSSYFNFTRMKKTKRELLVLAAATTVALLMGVALLFQVSYDKNRINFEVYHALTDGTGAMHFLQELVQNYLILAHPQANLPRSH